MLNNLKYNTITPLKIISLVPSQTELLHYLGLSKNVIGITKFCVHPASWYKNKTRVGGTKNLNFNQIKSLNPNLIIANKEENVKEQVQELQKLFNVLVTDVNNLQDAFNMISEIGYITNTNKKAENLVNSITENFIKLHTQQSKLKSKSVCYLIWKDPYMTIGGDKFISSIIKEMGLINIFENKLRYPETSLEEIQLLNPDYIFLSSEPYPFKEKHKIEILNKNPQIASKIIMEDGEMFSWYGSRLLYAANYLNELLQKLKN